MRPTSTGPGSSGGAVTLRGWTGSWKGSRSLAGMVLSSRPRPDSAGATEGAGIGGSGRTAGRPAGRETTGRGAQVGAVAGPTLGDRIPVEGGAVGPEATEGGAG